MSQDEVGAQERILQATAALLQEVDDVSEITVRQIAEKAGVSLGSINYYYRSKENLLNQAVNYLVGDVAAGWYRPLAHQDMAPTERLRKLFHETAEIMVKHARLSQITVSHALLQGDMAVQQLLLPLLGEIFGSGKSELELRLLSFQLVTPMHVALLRLEAFGRYSGLDLLDPGQRKIAIDLMLDNFLASSQRPSP